MNCLSLGLSINIDAKPRPIQYSWSAMFKSPTGALTENRIVSFGAFFFGSDV